MSRENKQYKHTGRLLAGCLRIISPVIRFAFLLFWLIPIFPHTASALDYTYQQNSRETLLIFRYSSPLKVTPLDPPSMTSNIVLKISGLAQAGAESPGWQWSVPEFSAVSGYRFIPYNKNVLLIVDLLHPVDYQLNQRGNGFEIVIKDALFRDPVEFDFFRGMALQHSGDYDQALALYRQVAGKRAQHRYVFFKAGQIRLLREEYDKAEINFKRALANGCDSSGVYLGLAKIYRVYGNKTLAERYEGEYRRITAGNKQNAPAKDFLEDVDFASASAMDTGIVIDLQSAETPATADARNMLLQIAAQKSRWLLLPALLIVALVLSWVLIVTARRWKAAARANQAAGDMPIITQNAGEKKRLRPKPVLHTTRPEVIVQPPKSWKKPAEDPAFSDSSGEANSRVDALIEQLLGKTTLPVGTADTGNSDDEDLQILESAAGEDETVKLARELNLGQGEVELALKLSSLQQQTNRQRDIRAHILSLRRQNLSIDEIARQSNLGKGEVELFLRLAQAASKKPS